MGNENISSESKRGRRLLVGLILVVVLMGALLTLLIVKKERSLGTETRLLDGEVKSGKLVYMALAKPAPSVISVVVVGEARPYATATLYAKVSGYVKEIRVDKGDRVTPGQILAVIESPEIDRQVDGAKSDAKSKRDDAKRALALLGKNAIAFQDWERLEAAAQVSEANYATIKAQQEYEMIRAPFGGTVAVRYVDPGALVQTAVASQTAALPVLTLSRVDRLRVYVYLDQKYANLVRPGDPAVVADSSRPGVKVSASVTRMSGELDPKTRTRLTEIEMDNRGGKIVAGSFVEVTLRLRTGAYVAIPADALLMRQEKPHVAIIDGENKALIRPVVIADTDGATVRLSSGLKPGEKVILSPGAGISDGQHVRLAADPK